MNYPDGRPAVGPASEAVETKVIGHQVMYGCPHHSTALVETDAGNLRVWHCATCSGLWLPAGAFHTHVGHVSTIGRGRPAGMSCPKDGHALTAVIHRGVEVDVCGACGGVWFDHGELQKILAQSTVPAARRFLDNASGPNVLDVASGAVDLLSVGDFAGEVVSAVFEFLAGLAP
jgi:Zn-finger nucleic acid-binding protein